MSNTDNGSNADVELRDEWLTRLSRLVDEVRSWVEDLGWATRRVEKRMRDPDLGVYVAPGLVFQEDFVRVMLEPITHSAPGADGVVDLYLMPAYDDIATVYYEGGEWHVHYMYGGARRADETLSKQTLTALLDEMKQHAAAHP